jgi:CBS domain-containing protein
MLVQAILNRKGSDVITVSRDATIGQAARMMSEHRVGALVVTLGDEVVGILSDREVVSGLARHRERLSTVPVSELMRREVVSVSPQEHIKRVMMLMTRHRTTHVPVLAAERLVGIVSIGDVVKHRLEELEMETNVLRDAYFAVR